MAGHASMDVMDWILVVYWVIDISLVVVVLPYTVNIVKLPTALKDLVMFGKIRGSKNISTTWFKALEIPKSWFLHYYIYGIAISAYMLALTVSSYIYGYDIPGRSTLVQWFHVRHVTTDHVGVMMVCSMMLIQHIRRTYECIYVSVYSSSTMNVMHYLLGAWLYSTVQLSVLSDGPKLDSKLMLPADDLPLLSVQTLMVLFRQNALRLFGVVLFVLATYGHHHSHAILGNLRKDRHGRKVIHRQHVLPRGGLFEYLSSPHMLCEILIYISLGCVAQGSVALWLGPVLFTVVNQILVIVDTHRWYRENIASFSKLNRRMFIPYLF